MNASEAIELMLKETNGMIPISGQESTHYYFFVPAWPNGQLVGNGSTFVVNKDTGNFGWHAAFTPMSSVPGYVKYDDDRAVENSTLADTINKAWEFIRKQQHGRH